MHLVLIMFGISQAFHAFSSAAECHMKLEPCHVILVEYVSGSLIMSKLLAAD